MRNSSSQKGYPISYEKHRLLDQKLHTTQMNILLCSKVVMKIFHTFKGAHKPNEKSKKVCVCEQASKDTKGNGRNTKKDTKTYLEKGKLSIEEIKSY